MGDRVLLVGSGGREHALAWKLAQSNHVSHVFIAPGNAGTDSSAKMKNIPSTMMNPNDNENVVHYCKENKIDFVVVGPEAPLANGIADALNDANIPCFGPSKQAARIECSKAFAKDFMKRHGIPTARSESFIDVDKAVEHIRTASYPALVVKASGLAAGKGVIVASDKQGAEKAVKDMLKVARIY
jgi:phosphoribosylamine--glycine ligase/phosphoribosylglycinamide formyltransferase/phosphoribosylformylglycinamidine cyclo-ligase